MNGLRTEGLALARAVADAIRTSQLPGTEALICPPATLLAPVGAAIEGTGLALGGQDCSPEAKGAFTGDVSAAMLADLGCRYVIVGHSERRQFRGETDTTVAKKAAAAQAAGLSAIVCVGERGDERARGATQTIVLGQMVGSLPPDLDPTRLVVAYEPVWAIGSGRTPTPAEIAEVHGALRRGLGDRFGSPGFGIRLLYGGSVTTANAAAILAVPAVDGALVGGASLKASDFIGIIRAAA
ncbi:MAG: triose-phosphate isomerase [Alphaproteobacteria bacterium]|nr:triose-phosphate isomerase [Alphaproteobacteria bacterium]